MINLIGLSAQNSLPQGFQIIMHRNPMKTTQFNIQQNSNKQVKLICRYCNAYIGNNRNPNLKPNRLGPYTIGIIINNQKHYP